ncbi:unnamed protein product [Meganyctiphanes norvegica]|uniref:Uncharacterized protein n=1 Tax=Meganyctiphanes norvegica TaxID=48144 RepID=A0AAV2RZZ6_MEGNR
MAAKGVIALIVLCFTSAAFAAESSESSEVEGRAIDNAPAAVNAVQSSDAEAEQRLFLAEDTSITLSTETIALGILILGVLALAIVLIPLLLGGGEEATATGYTAPSTYATDPYSAARSARSTFSVLHGLSKAAAKYL